MRRRYFFRSCIGVIAGWNARLLPRRGTGLRRTDKDALAKVIGTAQDGGIPHMGCFCPNCQQAWQEPQKRRLIASLALFDPIEDKTILIDATPDIRVQTKILMERGMSKKNQKRFLPDGIILTHAHIGHYTGLMFYGYEAQSADRLPVYCSERMKRFLSENGPWSQLVNQNNISIKIIRPGTPLPLTSHISILALQVPHRDEFTDTLGFKIKGPNRSLLYIPDIQSWQVWDRSIEEEIRKVDIALLDGTFYSPEELPSRDLSSIGHPFICDSMARLENVARNKKIQVYFTHLNHSNIALAPESSARKAIKRARFDLAEEGMEFLL